MTNLGYSNYLHSKINKTHIYDDLLAEKKAVIAHRFGKLTFQPYSLKSIEYLISNKIFLIEIDVNLTQDVLDDDKIFYLSHGNMEEVAAEDKPTTVLSTNFKNVMIQEGNNLFAGCSAPSLADFFEFVKNLPVCILMEDKSEEPQKLFNYCQSIGLTSEYCIFQDFDNDALDIFKAGGYKVMKIGSSLTTQEIADYDYYCCNASAISTFQGYTGVDNFIYYTNADPYDHIMKLDSSSKLSGCFSDTPIATRDFYMVPNISMLNPYNGHISIKSDPPTNNIFKYIRYYQDGDGDFNIKYNNKIGNNGRAFINCFNYQLKQETDYVFYADKELSTNNVHWIGVILKLGKNVAEYDDSDTRLASLNMLIRADNKFQIYTLLDGTATQDSNTSFTNYKYFKFNVSPKVNDNNSFILTVSGSITKDGSFTLINSIEALYSDYDNFTDEQPMYLCFVNRDSWSGSVKFFV